MAIIGIDLGTTNSLVACYRNEQVEMIPNSLGEYLTPSVVSILSTGEVVIGKAAQELAVTDPINSAKEFKRFMGTEKTYYLAGNKLSPVDLSALVIKSLVSDAEEHLGERVEEAVISVPAYFNEQQRKATIEAALVAGVKVERLINEPTAAATAYHLNESKNEKIIVIVDLGGGTFDVSILDIFESVLEVRAVAGDNYLGGQDFDLELMNYICLKEGIDKSSLSLNELAKLKFLAEKCKIRLSDTDSVDISFSIKDKEHIINITKNEFNKVIKNLLLKMKMPLKKAIRDANFSLNQIDEIIMVGGSTKMPAVKSFIATLFGRLPLCHLNPDEVVARGAAVFAAMKEHDKTLEDIVLTDVCPFTLGIETTRTTAFNDFRTGIFSPIIERNTTVPCSFAGVFTTTRDYQEKINVKVYQGESRNVSDNLLIGNLEISVPPLPKSEADINVRFTYDINGILEVEVKSMQTGETVKAIMLNKNNLSKAEIEGKLSLIENLKIHPKDQDENLMLIAKGNRYYESTLGEIRDVISHELTLFEAALETQHPGTIEQAKERLVSLYRFIEEEY